MNVKHASKTAEEATVEKDTETKTVKAPRVALIGVKKGAVAAKQAVSKLLRRHRDYLIALSMVPVTEYPMGPFLLL